MPYHRHSVQNLFPKFPRISNKDVDHHLNEAYFYSTSACHDISDDKLPGIQV